MSRNIQGILLALLGGALYSAHDALIKALGADLTAIQTSAGVLWVSDVGAAGLG